MNTMTFVHAGRAANCACKDLKGRRCPNCNHVLTGSGSMVTGGEGRLEHEEVVCTVCGTRLSDEIDTRDIRLTIHNVEQKVKTGF